MRGESKELGIRALNRRAEQHALGRAVVWRDAAAAATTLARTPQEQAAATILRDEALSLATRHPLPAGPTAVLVASLLFRPWPRKAYRIRQRREPPSRQHRVKRLPILQH